jgi:uroporphyrinogen-III synthase
MLSFDAVPDHDRIFFSSRNAVRGYVEGGGDLLLSPCDTIGAGTAEEVRKRGGEAVFIGDGPDTLTIARDYAERFGHLRILFPGAEKSLRSIQKALPEGHAIDLPVYAMRPVEGQGSVSGEVAIVTSPDHADALHAIAPLDQWGWVVAMGHSTAQRIRELAGIESVIPWASTEMALTDAIFKLATDH